MLKLQYFGHLMQRANSLEKPQERPMLGKIEGKRIRGRQRIRCLGSITDSKELNLSKDPKPGFSNTWTVNFLMFKLDLEKAEEPEIKLPTSAGSWEKQESSKKSHIYFCFIDYAKAFDCVNHSKLWKILKEMGKPDHLTCLLRNLYAGQEAKGLSRVFSNTTCQKHQLFSAQPSSQSNSHIHTWLLEKP